MMIRSGFYDVPVLASSFFELQEAVFPSLGLRRAQEEGLLGPEVVPFAVFDEQGRAVSILNATTMNLCVAGRAYRSVQIGTVATLPQARGQGLAAMLQRHVMDHFEPCTDFQFLFANDTVLEFYPKFGFKRLEQTVFSIRPPSRGTLRFRRLDVQIPRDLQSLRTRLGGRRALVSNTMAVHGHGKLAEFYCTRRFSDALWASEGGEVILVAGASKGVLTVHDVLATDLPSKLFEQLAWEGIERIELGFTPDLFDGHFEAQPLGHDPFFVRGAFPENVQRFRFPDLAYT